MADPRVFVSAAVVAAYSLAHIIIGALYLDHCPIEPSIPTYVLVLGICLMRLQAEVLILTCDSESVAALGLKIMTVVDSTFLVCWIITGHVWTFSVYEPNYTNSTSAQYCDKTVYLWAFGNAVVVYIIVGLLCAGGCFCYFCDDD